MAEDDDEDTFGEFSFASASDSSSIQFNEQPFSSQISWPNPVMDADRGKLQEEHQDDDEWGDFIEPPLGSIVSSDSLSKPFDAFNFFASNPSSQSQLQSESARLGSESEKKTTQQWVNLKGAIPLSIFGDAEEEEEEKRMEGNSPGVNDLQDNYNGMDSGSNVSVSNYNVNDGPKGNAYLVSGIANLHDNNQKIDFNNGLSSGTYFSISNTNSVELSKKEPIVELSGLHLDLSGSAPKKGDSNTVFNLDNQSHKVNIEDSASLNGIVNSSLDALPMDFGRWNIDTNLFYVKSDMDAMGSISDQSQLSKANIGTSLSNSIGLDLTEKKSSNFASLNFNFDGFKPNSNGTDLEFQVLSKADSVDNDNEDAGWEFKDAYSESKVTNGNEKAQVEEHKVFEENKDLKFVNDSSRSLELFPVSRGSLDLFSMSNGFAGGSHNNPVRTDSTGVAAENGFGLAKYVKEQTKNNRGLDSPVKNFKYQGDIEQFAAAFEENGPREEVERNLQGNSKELVQIDVIIDTDPSAAPNVQVALDDFSLKTQSRSKNIIGQGVRDSHLVVVDAEYDDDFGEFTAASAESAHVPEGTKIRAENHKGPLPLSFFGVEEQEVDDSLDIQDAFLHQSESYKRDNISSNLTVSIDALLSHLYSQDDNISSVDSVHKPIQNGLTPSEAVLSSSLAEDTEEFDNCSWDFKDASLESGAENGSYLHDSGNSDHSSYSAQSKLNRYVDFYSKLLHELHFLAKRHLENLKESQATTANPDERLATLIEDIQDSFNESGPKNAISEESLGDYTQRESNVGALLKILQDPDLQILESEYSLQAKLSLVDKDSRLTMQLLKHTETTLKILSLGSLEEKLTYVSIWSRMISVCMEELQYGAQVWRQACEKNILGQILIDPRGKIFLLSLGEIYRVVIILEASVKLYKPWVLLSPAESPDVYRLLDECHILWQSSGLEEAIVANSLNGNTSASLLVDSIKYSHDLDATALENHVFVQQGLLCRLSLLSSSVVPGMKVLEWGGHQCFVKLANLWANLISNDIPKLPSLCVSC